ncbi:hypothetical protein ACFL27_17685 [candidate division CSSED10-310 bacterium]|uniref:Rubrerythrin diiron-binding domain-containing protein n=1 Tax=candidate division CSSED10-310 bacterium TaxID=2855610 RepID=A0ABV6Z141_UNCC1
MKTKELQEKLVETMKSWQKVENASVSSTGQIIEKTENPVVRLVMEIIQRDSQLHYRVQEMIVNSLEQKALSLTPEELGEIWEKVEKHIEIENRTIELAQEALTAVKGKKLVIQEYLINYLLEDEEKHNKLLNSLSKIKSGMYPYG